jgi:hypothetical protein
MATGRGGGIMIAGGIVKAPYSFPTSINQTPRRQSKAANIWSQPPPKRVVSEAAEELARAAISGTALSLSLDQ